MTLEDILDQIYPLPEASVAFLKKNIRDISLPKGYILLNAGKVENRVYLIKQGIVRAYAERDGNDATFWFGREGEAVISMRSYVENQPGYESIELLEDCEFYEISGTGLQSLYLEDIHIANWGRKFAEQELVKTETRLISRHCQTATERYLELLANNPDLLQRVQLGYIASYLGITQVSLSRIRAEVR